MKNNEITLKKASMMYTLKKELGCKYINWETMSLIVLSQDNKIKKQLCLLDYIQYELDNCIRFDDFHRGVKYLLLMRLLCEKIFDQEKLETYRKQIDLYIRK
ncbi:hypothetical protein SAMN04487864_104258 [Succiniclasticum ruminis]|uniref:Uncharacterized protein n=1 Tax=Succiniclasticum ruminis TaxID=40841 RepID=A0A1G6KIW9_9FIRM|nr:hypothetical protein [Succiniclasticum ruminis]SDC30266.1 hypothetical protein SAMN04487864_104258 [Succiniclasticum ruminis]